MNFLSSSNKPVSSPCSSPSSKTSRSKYWKYFELETTNKFIKRSSKMLLTLIRILTKFNVVNYFSKNLVCKIDLSWCNSTTVMKSHLSLQHGISLEES